MRLDPQTPVTFRDIATPWRLIRLIVDPRLREAHMSVLFLSLGLLFALNLDLALLFGSLGSAWVFSTASKVLTALGLYAAAMVLLLIVAINTNLGRR